MKVYRGIEDFKGNNSVVTIGIFDGIHKGHQLILEKLKYYKEKLMGQTVVITLWPHPRHVLYPNAPLELITGLEEKIELLSKYDIDHLIILNFTKTLANTPFNEFIENYLVNKIDTKQLVIGYNHHFGKDRKGGYNELQKSALHYNFGLERLNQVIINNLKVSSSIIREVIQKGDIHIANQLLGYKYFIQGNVIKGKQLGKTLGFPTANISPNIMNKLIPSNGVYAVEVTLKNKKHIGMLNIGHRPTIEEQVHNRTIEVNIFNFNEEIYNQDIKIEFVKRIRDEKKFININELKKQLTEDKKNVMHILTNK